MIKLLQKIMEAENLHFLFPASAAEIREAEEKLNLVFADDFCEYLLAFGVASFNGNELTGICKSKRLSVIETTERARTYQEEFPADLYVIADAGYDSVLILQNGKGEVFEKTPDGSINKLAESLFEFFFPEDCETENQ